jgi:hypothetical protein
MTTTQRIYRVFETSGVITIDVDYGYGRQMAYSVPTGGGAFSQQHRNEGLAEARASIERYLADSVKTFGPADIRRVQVLTMSAEVANGGHDVKGGTIISGTAVCECGLWRAKDHKKADREASRKAHLAEVLKVRLDNSSTSGAE